MIDAFGAQPQLLRRAGELDEVRIELELLPPPQGLVDRDRLESMKVAAVRAGLHNGAPHAVLSTHLPREIRERAARTIDDLDELNTWFDAANRQLIDPGEGVLLEELLRAAIDAGLPAGRPGLRRHLDTLRLLNLGAIGAEDGLSGLSNGHIESIVEESGIMLDGGRFYDLMGAAMRRVCLVRIGGADVGTGFLVGPDLLLTARHVLRAVLDQAVEVSSVRFVFDYRTRDGVVGEGPGVGLKVSGQWRVDDAPATDQELDGAGSPEILLEADPSRLDFALVRLDQQMGRAAGGDGHPRGWFDLHAAGPAFPFSKGAPLMVIGHPYDPGARKASPLTWSVESDAVIGLSDNRSRVRYRTNTLRGSSGSPVLSAQWQVVALHHYGRKYSFNQGIPSEAILARPAVAQALAPN